mmetsp:Transcript_22839/g.26031  ORF Transcript_22839/g.26031 Transcript_22839/m.26031 type:complete len:84 (+) Transcript_22839:57-308(+)
MGSGTTSVDSSSAAANIGEKMDNANANYNYFLTSSAARNRKIGSVLFGSAVIISSEYYNYHIAANATLLSLSIFGYRTGSLNQ